MSRGHLPPPRLRTVATGLFLLAAFFVTLLLLDALPGFITPAYVQELSEDETVGTSSEAPVVPEIRARLAVVIDDWGYPSPYAAEFFNLGIPLTAAIIPHESASQRHLAQAQAAGFDVLVHLPMEPGNAQLVTPGMITVDLSPAEVKALTREAVRSLPGVVGISNHMGSKATEDERVVDAVLAVTAEEGLLFLDSRTSSRSVAAARARKLGVPVLENAAFLDGQADIAYIREQLLLAAKRALRNGAAVAIGHVRVNTAQAIKETLPELERMGVQLVRISELVGN